MSETNVKCSSCGKQLYRNFSQQTQSKSGLYFCNKYCKSIFWKGEKLCSIPTDHLLFNIIKKAYTKNRNPEYLTGIYIIKIDPKHINRLGEFIITASARTNKIPHIISKTPKDIDYIRQCFNNIKIIDINSLPEFEEDLTQNWKRIKLKMWNYNDITYTIEE